MLIPGHLASAVAVVHVRRFGSYRDAMSFRLSVLTVQEF